MKLSTCTDRCLNDSAQCFDTLAHGAEHHYHFVAPEPYKAPSHINGEHYSEYMERLVHSFEEWVNKRR